MARIQEGTASRGPLPELLRGIGCAADAVAPRLPYGPRIAKAARGRLTRLLEYDLAALPHRDAYIVGYPKVGNTWFQVMLRMALVRYYGLGDEWLSKVIYPQIDIDEPAPVPLMEMTHDMSTFPEGDYRKVQRDHRRYRGKPVVLLIRDPKDALVSLYRHYVYRDADTVFRGTVDGMVHDAEFGLDKMPRFYRSWYRHRHWPSGLHLVRCEDMKVDTARSLRGALEFLGLAGISDAIIGECLAFGSFQNMRRMEVENALGLPALAPPSRDRENTNAFKVRRGEIGGYVRHLSPETIAHIDRRVRRELPAAYGYPLAERTSQGSSGMFREGAWGA